MAIDHKNRSRVKTDGTLVTNSSGNATLSQYDQEEGDAVIEKRGPPAQTMDSITDRDELKAELELVREQGYALNLGEDIDGIHAIGVPVGYENKLKVALAVAGPHTELPASIAKTNSLNRSSLRSRTPDPIWQTPKRRITPSLSTRVTRRSIGVATDARMDGGQPGDTVQETFSTHYDRSVYLDGTQQKISPNS
jgi:hypothetical protein